MHLEWSAQRFEAIAVEHDLYHLPHLLMRCKRGLGNHDFRGGDVYLLKYSY